MWSRETPEAGLSRRDFLARVGVSVAATAWPGLATSVRGAETTGAATGLEGERTFRESREVFANPERGFYRQRSTARLGRLDGLRDEGISLLLLTLDLRDFKTRELTEEKLLELRGAFAAVREHGLKIIFRAAYGFTGQDYRADPTDLSRITGHIRQIGAVLTEERDVLCGIQAGMLGPWGEWHGSNHGNPPSLEARRAVLFGWLDAVPTPITVHVRRPMFIRDIFATEPGGNELTASTMYTGSQLSRTGWHNDAFLARPSDLGTYAERGWDRQRELEWCNRHSRYTPFGGETVFAENPMPREEMIREMELLRATYLNIGYHPRVLQLWRESEYRGENMFQHIARRLGYRFVAERVRYTKTIRRGDVFGFELTLRNVGFASPHLPHVPVAGLRPGNGTGTPAAVGLTRSNASPWLPEAGVITAQGQMPVPTDLPAGPCQLVFRMADPSPRLREHGRYAIRLANDDIAFSAQDGWHTLASDLTLV